MKIHELPRHLCRGQLNQSRFPIGERLQPLTSEFSHSLFSSWKTKRQDCGALAQVLAYSWAKARNDFLSSPTTTYSPRSARRVRRGLTTRRSGKVVTITSQQEFFINLLVCKERLHHRTGIPQHPHLPVIGGRIIFQPIELHQSC